ncbi:unnamed protein product [Owenia fusiformis]|uniref:Uncharacterized protein n=1 Tax=Owenia fusiformis TaxID=6347 RepID=A0A8S4N166_OWEFU|nr:unnamed protein product [Owenia fusiformis]
MCTKEDNIDTYKFYRTFARGVAKILLNLCSYIGVFIAIVVWWASLIKMAAMSSCAGRFGLSIHLLPDLTLPAQLDRSLHTITGGMYDTGKSQIYPKDLECISSMVTFEHLYLMCQNISVPSPTGLRNGGSSSSHLSHDSLGRNMPTEPSISQVPFAFDLIGILPKCQQVEVLLSTLIPVADQKDEISQLPPPNNILFALMVEALSEIHDREIHLSEPEHQQFLQLLGNRQRDLDEYPLPFPMPSAVDVVPEVDTRRQLSSDSLQSQSTMITMLSQSQSSKSFEKQDTPQGNYGAGVNPGISEAQEKETSVSWRCFVKSISPQQVILMFIPASYDDLLCLMESKEQSNEDVIVLGKDQTSQRTGSDSSTRETSISKDNLTNEHIENVTSDEAGLRDIEAVLSQGESIIKNEHEKPVIEKLDLEKKAECKASVTLPVYFYNCSLNNITEHLVNRWSYEPPDDIFQDLRFENETLNNMTDNRSSEEQQSSTSSKSETPRTEELPNKKPETPRRLYQRQESFRSHLRKASELDSSDYDLSGTFKARSFARDRTTSEQVFGDNIELQQHCMMVSESYYKSFVTGVFKSLQLGQKVDIHDVESAINGICEEKLPVELDISPFLQTVCSHLQGVIEKINMEERCQDDIDMIIIRLRSYNSTIRSKLENKSDVSMLPVTDNEHSQKKAGFSDLMSPEPTPRLKKSIPLPLSLLQNPETCERVKGLHNLIRIKFEAIMENWFKPVPTNPDFFFFHRNDYEDEEMWQLNQEEEQNENTLSKAPEAQDATAAEDSDTVFTSDFECATPSEHGTNFDSVKPNEYDAETISNALKDDLESLISMNEDLPPLFLHLMCSVKTKGDVYSVSVRHLPTCLGELRECLVDRMEGSDLDLNDLQVTLDMIFLTLPEDTEMHLDSAREEYNREVSYESAYTDNVKVEQEETKSTMASTDVGFQPQSNDPLSNLPGPQNEAIKLCRDKINWLLRDEIASAMRQVIPLTENTLAMVAKHVEDSKGRPACIHESVPLQFVYGPEQSLTNFVEQFERMDLPGFHLNKEGEYYYLVLDRLRRETTTEPIITAEALSTALNQLNGGDTQKTPEDVSKSGSFVLLKDDSGRARHERSPMSSGERSSKCVSEDITISLTHPSPVKEIPPFPLEELSNRSLEDIGTKSSGSSIQVLEEEAPCIPSSTTTNVNAPVQPPKQQSIIEDKIPENQTEGNSQSETVNEDGIIKIDTEITETEEKPKEPHVDDFETIKDIESGQDALEMKMDHYSEDQKDNVEIKENVPKEEDGGSAEAAHMKSEKTAPVIPEEAKTKVENDEHIDGEKKDEDIDEVQHEKPKEVPSPISPVLKSNEEIERSKLSKQKSLSGESAKGVSSGAGTPRAVPLIGHSPRLSAVMAPTALVCEDIVLEPKTGGKSATFTIGPALGESSPLSDTISPRVAVSDKSQLLRRGSDHELLRRRHSSGDNKHSRSRHASGDNKLNRLKSNQKTSNQDVTPTRNVSGGEIQLRHTSGSGGRTPRHSSGPFSSSRHTSGPETPIRSLSYADFSSQGSYTEGYEGDSSDSDDGVISMNESLIVQRPLLPNFWLIMQNRKDKVDIYFHTRDTGETESERIIQQKMLYNQVIRNIKETCHVVNQILLLQNLNETHMCNALLVPEADEDIIWKQDDLGPPLDRVKKSTDSSDDEDQTNQNYLAATLHFMPGHFGCECVWKMHFNLNPRLRGGTGRSSMARGIQALRSILNPFSVNNRKNMFVYREPQSGNVFYLRLNESRSEVRTSIPNITEATKSEEELPNSISRSSSIWSLQTKPGDMAEDGASVSQLDMTTTSRKPSINAEREEKTTRKIEECIILSAHGICPVGHEIRDELVKVLSNRLDDHVLGDLTVMLVRNPMCKLTTDDVQFIQKPFQAPRRVIRLSIPSSASLHLYALGYYLRQNLLTFLNTPKYMENKPENFFKDYSGPDPVPLKDSHIFLYNRPQQSGGKGIALIHFSLVDWRGNPVQLISSPKPSPLAYKDIIDATVFESMIATTIYERDPKSKRPGPTSLVQFSIWETGDVGLPQLTDRIMSSLKHAACDIIQEYRLLTVPICEVPQHYAKDLDSPFHSAPPSPSANMIGGSETLMSAKTPNLAVMSARPTSHQGFFDDDVTDILNRSRTNLRQEVLEEQDESIASRDSQRSNELRLKAQMYETGEKGALHQYFFTILPEWLNFCKKLGSPCVETSTQCSLISRYSVELVLREMQHIITNLCADSAPRVFRMIDSGGQEGEPLYMPYNPMRMPLNSDLLESSFDRFTNLQAPGKILNYVLVGRNVSQWRNSIDYVEADDEVSIGFSRSIKSIQKFKPLVDWSLEASTSSLGSYSAGPAPFSGGSLAGGKAFVPRQRLVLLTVKDTQLELYSYNWATDMAKTLASKFYRLVQWHKARSYLLNSIVSQKMGLFHHQKLQNALKDSSFKECPGEVDMLVKYTSPEAKDKEKARSRQVSGSGGMFGYGHPGLHSYDQVLMNSKPTKPMHKMPYGNYRDLVHRHGNQLLEVKHVDQKELDKQMKLENLYVMWQQRAGHAGLPITEDMLELLKQSSRLVHYVATPLLFSPHWRKEVMGLRKPQGVVPQQAAPIHPEVPTPAPAPTKSRSRHSSGASIKSLRSDSLQSLNKIKPHLSDVRNRHIPEEIWHGEIKGTFMQQYITYVQSLGFLQIRTRAASPKRLSRHMRPVSGADQNRRKHPSDDDKAKSNSIYLQKTLPGGIMLMEVGYSEVYFCVRLYAFESSRIPCGRSVNPQLAILFTDECDRMKDLVHVHSFAYDFHLRYIQTYIAGGQGAMKTGYHLRNFLQDFVQLYPYPPSFSRNYINEATITIENTNNPSHHLYNYMLNHSDKLFNMKAIKMVPVSDSDADGESDFALVCQSVTESDGEESDVTKPKLVDHNVGLVISHNAPGFIQQTEAERNTLKLQYFIILTSRREHFPKLTLEKKLGIFKNPLKTFYAGPTNDESMFTPEDLHGPPVTQHIGVRQESVNYLGFSNMHQTPIYTVLIQETDKASKKIREMVDSAISQCRRDTLWQRMLLGDQLVDDGRRKKRSETDESQDSGLTKLTFIEFQELMQVVERESLRQMDPRLTPLHNMSQSWYKGLVRVLMNKYSETHRYFASPDGKVQCVAILNPNYLDTFAMLTVDSINNKSELCVVYKEPILDSRLPANSGKQIYMQSHLEGFVNACCFHMWTGLL